MVKVFLRSLADSIDATSELLAIILVCDHIQLLSCVLSSYLQIPA